MGVPSEKRAQLVHLLNVSTPYSYDNPDFEILCNGIEELTEEFDADDEDIQYICETTTTRVISGYTVSMDVEMGYTQSNKIQNWFNNKVRILPTGSELEVDYIRFNKLEPIFGTSNKFIGVRRKATGYPTSIGGSATDPLGCNFTLAGAGDAKVGIVTITANTWGNTYSWADATTALPYVSTIGNKAIKEYYSGVEVEGTTVGTGEAQHIQVVVTGTGIPLKTISYIKSNAEASSTVATVGADGSWTLNVNANELSKSGDIYSIAFKQTADGVESVTTVPLKFKVRIVQPQQQNENP